jgi:phospholipid/cholesterol/gamma-HCH transport system substrate-binding protein
MAPRLTWSSLVPGIVAILLIAVATIALLVYGSVGRISGEKTRLHVVTNSARGVMPGTEVWLAGQKVGVVEEIGFRPPSSDTLSRVVITMDVREEDAAQIRKNSDVRVRAGANLVGPIVVYVSAGTPDSPPAMDGDTLFAAAQSDVRDAVGRLGEATKEFGPLMNDARAVVTSVRDPNGTIGALMRRGSGNQMAELRSQVVALTTRFGGTSATTGEGTLMTTARSALARADSIRVLLRSERSTLGRFRRDTTLGRTVADVRDELAALRARMEESPGTLGRFASDSAIQRALADAQTEMALLSEDVRKRPLRYLAF